MPSQENHQPSMFICLTTTTTGYVDLDIVERRRMSDGTWHPEGYYWPPDSVSPRGKARIATRVDIVDWGQGGPNQFITLNALRVPKAAGRI